MKVRKTIVLGIGIFALAAAAYFSTAYAYGSGGYEHGGGYHEGLQGKFFEKARLIQESQSELGLSDDKIEAVKSLELETKKVMIKQNADIEILKLDLKSKIREYPINVEAAQKLVDQKAELEKAQDRFAVEALAKLKSQLTKDQYLKLRALSKAGYSHEWGAGKQ